MDNNLQETAEENLKLALLGCLDFWNQSMKHDELTAHAQQFVDKTIIEWDNIQDAAQADEDISNEQ